MNLEHLPSVKNYGFTLTELIVVIVIMAIISSLAIPPFLDQLRRMESQQVESQLRGFLSDGKQSALIYHNPILLCVADKQYQCLSDNGEILISFIDKNNNNTFDTSVDKLLEADEVGLRFGKLMTRVALNKNYIQINPNTGNPIGYMGHIKYCPTDGNRSNMFKVTFSIVGQVKTKFDKQDPTGCN